MNAYVRVYGLNGKVVLSRRQGPAADIRGIDGHCICHGDKTYLGI